MCPSQLVCAKYAIHIYTKSREQICPVQIELFAKRTTESRLQCVAVCCSVLQCVAVCCSDLQCVAVCCRVLQRVAVCCSVLQCIEAKLAKTLM